LPAEFIHSPWRAGPLGHRYPDPIVDHQAARARALASFASLKSRNDP
jgi:deoxyribodipyrimidine photo-lyase